MMLLVEFEKPALDEAGPSDKGHRGRGDRGEGVSQDLHQSRIIAPP